MKQSGITFFIHFLLVSLLEADHLKFFIHFSHYSKSWTWAIAVSLNNLIYVEIFLKSYIPIRAWNMIAIPVEGNYIYHWCLFIYVQSHTTQGNSPIKEGPHPRMMQKFNRMSIPHLKANKAMKSIIPLP